MSIESPMLVHELRNIAASQRRLLNMGFSDVLEEAADRIAFLEDAHERNDKWVGEKVDAFEEELKGVRHINRLLAESMAEAQDRIRKLTAALSEARGSK